MTALSPSDRAVFAGIAQAIRERGVSEFAETTMSWRVYTAIREALGVAFGGDLDRRVRSMPVAEVLAVLDALAAEPVDKRMLPVVDEGGVRNVPAAQRLLREGGLCSAFWRLPDGQPVICAMPSDVPHDHALDVLALPPEPTGLIQSNPNVTRLRATALPGDSAEKGEAQ